MHLTPKIVLVNTWTNNHYINFEVTVFVPVKTIIKAGVRLRVLMHLVQTVCYFERSKNWGGSLGFYSQCHLCFEIWHIVIDVELRTSNAWTSKGENRKYLQTRQALILLKSHCMRSFHIWAYKRPFLSSIQTDSHIGLTDSLKRTILWIKRHWNVLIACSF